jgi:hypothetical protein
MGWMVISVAGLWFPQESSWNNHRPASQQHDELISCTLTHTWWWWHFVGEQLVFSLLLCVCVRRPTHDIETASRKISRTGKIKLKQTSQESREWRWTTRGAGITAKGNNGLGGVCVLVPIRKNDGPPGSFPARIYFLFPGEQYRTLHLDI